MKRKKAKRIKYEQEQEPKAVQEMKKNKNKKNNKKVDTKIEKEERKIRKKKKIRRIIFLIIVIIILIFGIKLGISTHTWKTLAKDMTLNENSVVKDIDGNEIAKLGSEKKKITVSSNEIPSNLKNAYVAIEDERFYSHNGVDIKRTASAIGSYVIHFGSSSFGRKYDNTTVGKKSHRRFY